MHPLKPWLHPLKSKMHPPPNRNCTPLTDFYQNYGSLPESPDFLRNQDFFRTFLLNNLLAVFSDPNADPNGSGQRKASDSTGEDIPHRLRRLELCVGGDVGVGVQREACGVMTQHRGHGFYIHAVLQRQRGEGVTQVMETHLRQPCPLQDAVQHVQHAVRGHGASGG